jgi:hypothetical protein
MKEKMMKKTDCMKRLIPGILMVSFVFLFFYPAQARSNYAPDYELKPVPPALSADQLTTFMVDWSKQKTSADQAAGNPAISTEGATWKADSGLSGPFSFSAPGNLDPSSFTVEMIIRVHAGADADPRVGWSLPKNYNATLGITGFNLWGKTDFNLSEPFGIDGVSLGKDGIDQWVYLAFGVDLANRLHGSAVRTMDGNILKKNMLLAWKGKLNTGLGGNAAKEQNNAAIAKTWDDMAKTVLTGDPSEKPTPVTIGWANADIMKLRISKGFRKDVLMPHPDLNVKGAERTFLPRDIRPDRIVKESALRTIGYPGYHNYGVWEIPEESIALRPGDYVMVNLGKLPIGLYSMHVFGIVDPKGRTALSQIWKPCPMDFEVVDGKGKKVAMGRRLLKQAFFPQRMQGFDMHVDEPGTFTATFRVAASAMETALIQRIAFIDQLKDLPDASVKTSQNIAPGKNTKLTELTESRKQRDDAIWAALPPLNIHLQVHPPIPQFSKPPAGADMPAWETKAFVGKPPHEHIQYNFSPLDMSCPGTGGTLTHEQVISSVPWPGAYADDGTGIYLTQKEFPELKSDIYYSPRANLLGKRVQFFLGQLGTWDYRGASLPKKYFDEGDPDVGHDAAMALVRLAYDWPALEMNLHELRLSTQNPDLEYNTDWSADRNGKYFYRGWSGDGTVGLMNAYDQVFPYIQNNQLFADEVHRFIPWVKSPEDVIRFLDRQLVFASVRDFNRGLITSASVEDVAAQVLGPHPLTSRLFDLTKCRTIIYPYEGNYEDLYATALSRCGSYHIGAFMCYAFGDASGNILKANIIRKAKENGVKPPMDLSDINQFPKVRAAGDFLIDMFFAGGFPAMIGDASGGPHTGRTATNILKGARTTSEAAFNMWGDPRHAWLLVNLNNNADPAVVKAAKTVKDPIMHSVSRVVPEWMAVVEEKPDSSNPMEKTAMMMRLGIGQGHAHDDFLDLNLFGMGLPLAVDLACRNEGHYWSRPKSGAGYVHNHAMICPEENPYKAQQDGEPWLRAFAPPLIRASYLNGKGTEKLERDTVLVQDGNRNQYYVLDIQRLTGAGFHTWSFHGCESDALLMNVEMSSATDEKHPWLGRTLEGTQKKGIASGYLQAVWTMTREPKEYPHKFEGGGIVKTVACEQAVLGDKFNASLPPVHVRSTLLGRAGDEVLQGNPYSQIYSYCFPFLWIQNSGNDSRTTVYPAIYDWYRGDTPVVKTAELVSKDNPVVVKVTTNSGQIDTFTQSGESFSIVSRDAEGLRWARLSGGKKLKDGDLEINADLAKYSTTVLAIDYVKRTLSTKDPLPPNPRVTIGSAGNHRYLDLKGSGTEFTFKDDLLIQEGVIQKVQIKGEQVEIDSTPEIFKVNSGNRKLDGFTIVLKGTEWQFKGDKVISKPSGASLTPDIFKNPNGEGYGKTKIYEIGLNDTVELLADVDVRRTDKGYVVKANVKGEATVKGKKIAFAP